MTFSVNSQVHMEAVSKAVSIEIKDKTPPSIEITNLDLKPEIPYIFTNQQLNLVGYVQDNRGLKYFTVNRDTVKVDEEGFFEYRIFLNSGPNNLLLSAVDMNKNTNNQSYKIILEGIASRDYATRSVAPVALNAGNGKYYAIIIGVSNYSDSRIMSLDEPVTDAVRIHNILTTRYTFDKQNSILLKNATRAEIINAFDELSEKLTVEDNLLIFYAGHGHWDEEKNTGYWLPSDADRNRTSNWLRNSTIQGYIESMHTRHTLLIADACFSGGIFKTRKAFNDAPDAIENLYSLKSRKGMTSGMLKEVPDKSVFINYLAKRLESNENKYMSSLELFYQLRTP
ncbi:MAG TPA: hypothetical protein DCX54_01425, partial [Flavobacteriales bacterium]|nr:hypothetical protein [Flavobacteriales bacterium]